MNLIRYRTFKYPPSYASNVPFADFDFFADAVLNALREKIAHFEDHPKLLTPPNRRTCKRLQVLARRCDNIIDGTTELTLWPVTKKDSLWWIIGKAVLEDGFLWAHCLSCERAYSSRDCGHQKWQHGEGWMAEGGWQTLCPRGHLLFQRQDWHT